MASGVVVKVGVSPSRSRLLTGSHRYRPGIVQQAQGRSAETVVSPHHNNQSTVRVYAGFIWLKTGVSGSFFVYGNELSVSIIMNVLII
jgi:hypothetical protein